MSGAAAGLGTIATGAAVSLLAASAAVVQPRAGRALDSGQLTAGGGIASGLLVTACGLALGAINGLGGILAAALLIGIGTGLITPIAFAALASSTPPERLGQTMGAAELGRELGDAGGPLLVPAVATVATLGWGYVLLALVLTIGAAVTRPRVRTPATVG